VRPEVTHIRSDAAESTGPAAPPSAESDTTAIDAVISRILTIGTGVSMALVAIGVALLLISGRSPLGAAAPLALDALPGSIARLEPEGFLWLGLIAILVTPFARVVASGVGFARANDRPMVLLAIAVLVLLALGIVIGVGLEAS
jgi:uncharacterized membrane protein